MSDLKNKICDIASADILNKIIQIIHARKASDINNAGLKSQIDYLLDYLLDPTKGGYTEESLIELLEDCR